MVIYIFILKRCTVTQTSSSGTEDIWKVRVLQIFEQTHNSSEITMWHMQSRPPAMFLCVCVCVSVFFFFSYFSDVTQRGDFRRYEFRHEKCDWLQLSRLLGMTNGVVVQLQAFQLNLLLKLFSASIWISSGWNLALSSATVRYFETGETNCDSRVSLMTVPCLIIWMF